MTTTRHTGALLTVAIATLLALALGVATAAAAPGTIRALDLSTPSLGRQVSIATPGGGAFSAEPGRALVRVTPVSGPSAQVLAWCVDPASPISEGIDYPVDLQTPADTPALSGAAFSQAGWLISASDGLIAAAPNPGLEAAAIQVAVWQITGGAADVAAVTGNTTLNARVAQLRALAAGRTLVTALAISGPAAPVAVGAPVALTITATPGAVVDLAVTAGTATLSSARVVVDSSGTAQVTVTPSAPGPVTIGASAEGGTLHRAARIAGRTSPQGMAFVTPVTLSASATLTAVAPAVTPPTTPPAITAPVTVARVPAVLGLTKAAPAKVQRGRIIAYRLTVTNTGTVAARDVVVRDPVPAGAYVGILPSRARLRGAAVVWRLGTLAPGAHVTVGLTLRTSITSVGDVVNVANATAANAATVHARARTQLLLPARVKPARVQPAVTG